MHSLAVSLLALRSPPPPPRAAAASAPVTNWHGLDAWIEPDVDLVATGLADVAAGAEVGPVAAGVSFPHPVASAPTMAAATISLRCIRIPFLPWTVRTPWTLGDAGQTHRLGSTYAQSRVV